MIVISVLIALMSIQKSFSYTLYSVPDGRIVGGASTTIQQFPHQVSLRYQNRHRCGGSIISENVVLTAAHCVTGINRNQMIVRAGTTYRDSPGTDVKISKIIIHTGYRTTTEHDNDIAILILNDKLKYSTKIQAINLDNNLNNFNSTKIGNVAFVSGWGALREGGSSSGALNYVSILVVDQTTCRNAYYPEPITEGMLCAGVSAGGRDSCQGDSGGPLIVFNGGEPILIGVVSWGNGCARPRYPGVYAKVANYRSWISKNANV
ncbi:trypsin delta-like [Condylostylus longicornis]|uniref:trypsin delta-like n=1 Tax=Condylostylus longicornis TaxID=2530218 RepID=UPI00244DEEE9|nr:trypsin delta-like [Condylostylus longicornis]